MDICSCAFVCGPCRARRWDIFKYRRCFVQSQFSKNDLEAKQLWIYAVLLMSGPFRARRWDIFNYRGCCVQCIFSKKDLEAKQSWIYAVLLMSVLKRCSDLSFFILVQHHFSLDFIKLTKISHKYIFALQKRQLRQVPKLKSCISSSVCKKALWIRCRFFRCRQIRGVVANLPYAIKAKELGTVAVLGLWLYI